MQHPRVAGFVLFGTLAILACALRYSGSSRAGQQPEPSCVATDVVATPEEAIVCPFAPGCCVPPILASTADVPAPIVALHVRVPATAPVGQELEYHLSIENRSSAAAHHVVLRNPLPPNSRFVRAQPPPVASDPELLWSFGTLEGGGHREVLLVLAPTGTEDLLDCARVQFEHGQCVTTRFAKARLQLDKKGPSEAVLGDTLTYELTVANVGEAEAAAVKLTDTLPPGLEAVSGTSPLTWDLGALAPGQSRRVEYHVIAKSSGRLCDRASAVAAGGLHAEAESCVTVGEPRLTLTKVGPARRYLNSDAVYQITVSNAGSVPLSNVTITDALPANVMLVRASNGSQRSGNEVSWSIGALAPGARQKVEVALRAGEQGKVCNRAIARAGRGLTAQAEACTEFLGVSALLLEVVDTEDPVEVGAETSYVIVVRNQGTVAATNIRIEALVPEQMDINRVTGATDHRKDGRRIIFQPLTLQARSDARYVVYVRAIQPGDVRFKVDMNADILTSGPVHEEESTTIYMDVPGAPPRKPAGQSQSRQRRGAT